MQLLFAHEIDYLISQKKSISLEDVHWHWRFIRCPVWDSRQNRSPKGPNANPSSQQVDAGQIHSPLVPKSPTSDNSRELTPIPQIPSNGEDMDSDFESQSHEPFTQIQKRHMSVLPLDPRLQAIKDPITVKPYGWPSSSLNKNRSRKDITFKRSTRRNLS